MAVYRAPFPTAESRRPILRFPNELPVAGEPADVNAILERAHAALRASQYSKLLFVGDPGALVSPAFADDFARTVHDCAVVRLGTGRHYLQEDHPAAIGRAVAQWITRLESERKGEAA
jgi:haloalkane dehalogenase